LEARARLAQLNRETRAGQQLFLALLAAVTAWVADYAGWPWTSGACALQAVLAALAAWKALRAPRAGSETPPRPPAGQPGSD
jgi:predicted MFS family arabinose efflux permease